jgi:hypothetical protein
LEINRKLPGSEYLPETTIQAIDYSNEMNAIKQEYGPRYWSHAEAIQKAADLWGFNCNEFGVVPEPKDQLIVKGSERYEVQVDLSESTKGHYLIGMSTQTPISGFSYAPSVFMRLGYPSAQDTRLAGIYEAGAYLTQRLQNPCSCSSRAYQAGLENLLQQLQQASQPTLF